MQVDRRGEKLSLTACERNDPPFRGRARQATGRTLSMGNDLGRKHFANETFAARKRGSKRRAMRRKRPFVRETTGKSKGNSYENGRHKRQKLRNLYGGELRKAP